MLNTQSSDVTPIASPTLRQEGRIHIPRRPEFLTSAGNTAPAREADSATTAPRKSLEVNASFKAIESWVGKVTSVSVADRKFSALVVSDKQRGVHEEAEFAFDEISTDDENLVQPGAIFYWSVGYEVDRFGRRSTASVIRFRRLRHWTAKEIAGAKVRAAEYADWFLGGVPVAAGDTTAGT